MLSEGMLGDLMKGILKRDGLEYLGFNQFDASYKECYESKDSPGYICIIVYDNNNTVSSLTIYKREHDRRKNYCFNSEVYFEINYVNKTVYRHHIGQFIFIALSYYIDKMKETLGLIEVSEPSVDAQI